MTRPPPGVDDTAQRREDLGYALNFIEDDEPVRKLIAEQNDVANLVEITRVSEVTVDAAPRLGDFKRECCLANLSRPEKHNSRTIVQQTVKF